MAAIDQVVGVSITQGTQAVAQASFSIPLIVGPTSPGWTTGDFVHTYSSAAGMLTDGYTTSSPEYVYALAMSAQTPAPAVWKVGRRTTSAAAQVDTLTVNTLTPSHVYKVTVGSTVCSYTAAASGETQQNILTQLGTQAAAGAPVTSSVTGTGNAASLTLTATTPGQVITYSALDASLTRVATTAAAGIATDLASIGAQDNTWYGLVLAGGTDNDIAQAAAWVEGNRKIYIAISNTAAIGGSGTTDVASILKAGTYKRTALLYSVAALNQGADAAWLASQLAQTPGSNAWAFKSLAGISADAFSATTQANVIGVPVAGVAGKNANIYQPVGGVNVTQMGTTASGQYIDITVGLDWLQSQLQTNVYLSLASAKKVPYTDAGVAVLLSAVKSAIDQGIANGLIDGATTVNISAPSVATVSTNQRANRIAPTISFTCRLQGAFSAVSVQGTVTV